MTVQVICIRCEFVGVLCEKQTVRNVNMSQYSLAAEML